MSGFNVPAVVFTGAFVLGSTVGDGVVGGVGVEVGNAGNVGLTCNVKKPCFVWLQVFFNVKIQQNIYEVRWTHNTKIQQ